MAVQVTACVDMGEADRLPTFNRGTPMAESIIRSSDTPVAVTVFHSSNACYRLLPTTCLKYTKTHRKAFTSVVKVTNMLKTVHLIDVFPFDVKV